MLPFHTLVALTAFAFVSAVTPGPNNLMMMASGTNFGFARTGPHMAGVIIGFALMVLLVGLGLGAVFGMIPGSMTVLKVASTLYLLYLAWKIAMSAPPEIETGKEVAASGAKPLTFLQAAAFQWVNPKGWTMALTAAAVYVPPHDRVRGAIVVGLVFLATNVPSATIWAAAGVQLRRLIHRPRAYRAFNVIAALLLVASLYPVLFPEA